MLLPIFTVILVIAADQLTKYWAVLRLKPIGEIKLIPEVFHLTYVENKGAAFGMLADKRWVFMILSTVMIVAMVVFVIKNRKTMTFTKFCLALIIGGGIGNMIDRIFNGFVVDFINVTLIDFYVFNIADSAVCIGCGLLIIHLICDTIRQRKNKKSENEEQPDNV